MPVAEIRGTTFWIYACFIFIYLFYFLSVAITSEETGVQQQKISLKNFFKTAFPEIIFALNIARYSLFRWFFHLFIMYCFLFFAIFYITPGIAGSLFKGSSVLLLHDVLGVLFFLSLLIMLLRRIFKRDVPFPSEYEDYLSVIFLIFLVSSGVLLSAVKYRHSEASFIYTLFPESLIHLLSKIYSELFLFHIIFVWLFIIILPFGKLRHIFLVPLNLLLTFLEKGGREDIYEWSKVPETTSQEKS